MLIATTKMACTNSFGWGSLVKWLTVHETPLGQSICPCFHCLPRGAVKWNAWFWLVNHNDSPRCWDLNSIPLYTVHLSMIMDGWIINTTPWMEVMNISIKLKLYVLEIDNKSMRYHLTSSPSNPYNLHKIATIFVFTLQVWSTPNMGSISWVQWILLSLILHVQSHYLMSISPPP